MLRGSWKLTLVSLLAFAVMTACGAAGNEAASGGARKSAAADDGKKAEETTKADAKPSAPQVSSEPVELLLYSNLSNDDDYINDVFVKPVKAKYPNISIKYLQRSPGQTPTDLVASGNIPDLIIGSILNLYEFQDLGMFYDITPLIKKFQFDVKRVDPALIEQMKEYSDKGEIYGIPYKSNYNALFYNKEIFDKFGVPYPKDDMLWDDVVELARKVTRSTDGVDYMGLDPENINRLGWGLGIGFIDPKTNKPLTEQWKPAYELLQKIISIPGNKPEKPMKNGDKDGFMKDMRIAMMATTNLVDKIGNAKFNWDLVTYPQYPDHRGTFGVAGAQPLMISAQSKHKDQAFQVIETVMSDEVQKSMNRLGKVTALSGLEVKKTYAADLPYAKGKNLAAVYKLNQTYYKLSKYDDDANKITIGHSVDLYSGKDINTVIRETADDVTKAIQKENSK
jgi:multiple sugar transport system substrate-binding protein